jgi:hypothetical protein
VALHEGGSTPLERTLQRRPILGDEVMAAALIDRLLHHCHIVNIRGSSYRMRKHTDLSKILHSPPADSSPSPPKRKRARATEKTTN